MNKPIMKKDNQSQQPESMSRFYPATRLFRMLPYLTADPGVLSYS